MTRLISHLRKPQDTYHPRITSKAEAERVARDYNDHVQAMKMGNVMVLDKDKSPTEPGDDDNQSMVANSAGVPWKYSHLFLYYTTGEYEHIPKEYLRSQEDLNLWIYPHVCTSQCPQNTLR